MFENIGRRILAVPFRPPTTRSASLAGGGSDPRIAGALCGQGHEGHDALPPVLRRWRNDLAGDEERSKQRLARAGEVIRLEASTIAGLEKRLGDGFLRAVDMVLACEGLVVVAGVGKAGLVGQKISATLASTGTPSLFLHPTEALHGDLGRLRARDLLLLISNSGDSAETNALIGPA